MFAVVCAIAAAAPVAAQRQTPASRRDSTARDTIAVVLRPVEVRASILPTAGNATASGIPARVSAIDDKALRDWAPRSLPNFLETQPGVSVYDDLGTARKLNVSSRGFTTGPTVGIPSGVTVFFDGVRQNEADAQQMNFDLLPLEQVRRVEVQSGSELARMMGGEL